MYYISFFYTISTIIQQLDWLIVLNVIVVNLLKKIETFMKSSYRAILDDVAQMIEKYMSLVKNFPITFNGSKIRQTVENLINQLNKVCAHLYIYSLYLPPTISITSFLLLGVVLCYTELFDRSTQVDQRVVGFIH